MEICLGKWKYMGLVGIEPTHPKIMVFKTIASAYSATAPLLQFHFTPSCPIVNSGISCVYLYSRIISLTHLQFRYTQAQENRSDQK